MKHFLTRKPNNILLKISALFAVALSALSFIALFAASIISLFETKPEEGNAPSLFPLILSLTFATISLLPYIADAVLCIIKAACKIDLVFNIIFSIVILSSPLMLFVFWAGNILAVWTIYYLVLLGLEIASIVLSVKPPHTKSV